MGNSLRITPLTMFQIDDTCFDGLKDNLPKRPTNNRGYQDLLLTGFDVDEEVFITNLLLELGEMQLIYTQPDFFKFAVTSWALKEKDIWQRLYDTVFYKYNPIWNKDGTLKDTGLMTRNLLNSSTTEGENSVTASGTNINTRHDDGETEETRDLNTGYSGTITTDEDGTNNETRNLQGSDNATKNLTYGHTNLKSNTGTQTNSGTEEIINQVSAYNDTNFSNKDKSNKTNSNTRIDNLLEQDNGEDTEKGTDNHSTTDSGTVNHAITNDKTETNEYSEDNTGTVSTTHGNTITDSGSTSNTQSSENSSTTTGSETGTVGNNLTRVEQGNIGVTTTQQMIEAERELVKFNIYDIIIDSFKQRFCLLIY